MKLVTCLEPTLLDQGVLTEKHIDDAVFYASYKSGKLSEMLSKEKLRFAGAKSPQTDFMRSVVSGSFCVSSSTCKKMELDRCPDIDLIPMKVGNQEGTYFHLMPKFALDVRNHRINTVLPTHSNPNGMTRIDIAHPLLTRTRLFMLPSLAPGGGRVASLFQFSTSNSVVSEYDFLGKYKELALTGITPVEYCRTN